MWLSICTLRGWVPPSRPPGQSGQLRHAGGTVGHCTSVQFTVHTLQFSVVQLDTQQCTAVQLDTVQCTAVQQDYKVTGTQEIKSLQYSCTVLQPTAAVDSLQLYCLLKYSCTIDILEAVQLWEYNGQCAFRGCLNLRLIELTGKSTEILAYKLLSGYK